MAITKNIRFILCIIIVLIGLVSSKAQALIPSTQAIELGKVQWLRSYNKALRESKRSNKPILILFQEVPGCSTCQKYGSTVLSHPLIVEAIENEFVPLAVFNNMKGEDAKVLKIFNEPSWNNPVIRIINSKEKNIVNRISGSYKSESLVLNMILALTKSYHTIPGYMKLLEEEIVVKKEDLNTAYFSMYCFWNGEAFFGNQTGVIKTSAGFMNAKEVVMITYDTSKTSLDNLTKKAKSEDMKLVTNVSKFRIDSEPQYYLKNSRYRYLALSDLQKTKINSAIKNSNDPTIYLSPLQFKCLNQVNSNSLNLYDKDIIDSWQAMISTLE